MINIIYKINMAKIIKFITYHHPKCIYKYSKIIIIIIATITETDIYNNITYNLYAIKIIIKY